MPLFHQRVLEKHLKHIPAIDPRHAETLGKWAENLERGIYDSETQNDGEFIQRILIDVLGYVGSSDGAQWTVAKNQPVGKGNVDVALGTFTGDSATILAPLELKGAKTRDLDAIMAGRNKTPVQQAWEYAMDAKGAQWVLVSNYREIRLYAVGYGRKDYEAFDLATLIKPENYARFILLLSAQNLLGGKTLSLLKESEQAEKDITDDLYKDYKALRANLIKTIAKDNPDKAQLDIIRYTQTILDRILFVAFAEDKGLLPDKTLEKAFETVNPFNPTPVWENFKGLFHAINKGNAALNIPGYNGGLFADDPDLHSLNISDELCEGFKKIGEYDFDSEISVNILGHIFEQSITDLEELKAEAEGDTSAFDKKKGKRKKDGIFYTPPYITRYIVEQAVGGWLADRRKEIGFDTLPVLSDVDFESIKITGKRKIKHERNKNIAAHIAAWEAYKAALSQIKVLDPACGSGAFLNEVFDYLKNEGQTINNELARLTGDQTDLFRWDTHILANNIYGVDLNRESVEITKLSLWLKTANRNEKLTYLENNIKVGNSLIDDPAIAGDLAFDWHTEFAEIMGAGGFDVVVGNPPWVSLSGKHGQKIPDEALNWLIARYNGNTYMPNLFEYFIALSLSKLNKDGLFCMIVPDRLGYNLSFTNIRRQLLENTRLLEVVYKWDFPEIITDTVTVLTKNTQENGYNFLVYERPDSTALTVNSLDVLRHDEAQIKPYKNHGTQTLIQKILEGGISLGSVGKITSGFGGKSSAITKERISDKQIKAIRGSSVCRYYLGDIVFFDFIDENITGRTRDTAKLGVKRKILLRKTGSTIIACYDESGLYPEQSAYFIYELNTDYHFALAALNSKLCTWFYRSYLVTNIDSTPQIKTFDLEKMPIPKATKEQIAELGQKGAAITALIPKINLVSEQFSSLIAAELGMEALTKKLQQPFSLEKSQFLLELEKQIKPQKLSLAQKSEWMQHFEAEKAKALALKAEIDRLDAEIDQMVYTLYGLTPDEIAIVEGA